MRKRNKRLLGAFAAAALLLSACLAGGAWFLLGYSLKPAGDRSRDEGRAWAELSGKLPRLGAWRDSLLAAHALRDTTISAADGTPLHAYYIHAPEKTRRTAVIVHGYTDCAVRMMPFGRMYNRDLRMNVLLPDLRNAGRSGGDHFNMGWLDRLDVKRWIETAPALFGDSLWVVAHGMSMGAATVMMLSGEDSLPKSVRCFVEDCGYTSVDAQFTKELRERFGLPRFPLVPLASVFCGWRYGWNFGEASALEQVGKSTLPMLFIHGTADRFVPTAMADELYAAKTKGAKELFKVPGAPHACSYVLMPAEYTRRVARFLRRAEEGEK